MALYNNIENIPAKTFFHIMKTKDFQQLKPKPREKGLDKVFLSIYDDYFIQSDNEQAKEYLRQQNEIINIEYKISVLKQSLAFYFYNMTTEEMRMDFIKAIKTGFNIVIDSSKPFIDEVKRVLEIEIGILKNDLTTAKINLESLKISNSESDFNYYDDITGIANVLTGNSLVKDDMTLSVYVAVKKSAIKQVEASKNKK